MNFKQAAFAAAAEGLIANFEKRGMEGYFYEDCASCTAAILEKIPSGSTVAWGGSESIKECGLMEALLSGSYILIDRLSAKTPEEGRELYAKAVLSDYFLMSANALTYEGELVNIDGMGNRAACLMHGPSNVIVVAGMNKLTSNVEEAINRVRNFASPPNAKRLGRQTPCNFNGRCGNCLSPDCMCNQIVVTRRSGIKGRIKVFLVAENLGF